MMIVKSFLKRPEVFYSICLVAILCNEHFYLGEASISQIEVVEATATKDALIFKALDKTYNFKSIRTNFHHYDNLADRNRSSDPNLISARKCERHLNYLVEKLDTNRLHEPISPELAAFFDSYGREESGLYDGNNLWGGIWKQCYKRQILELDGQNPSNSTYFKGRYCVASLKSKHWDSLIEKRINESFINETSSDLIRAYENFFRLQLGICLPDSCDSMSILEPSKANLIKVLTMKRLNDHYKSYDLIDLYCLPDSNSELRRFDLSTWLLIAVALSWCSLVSSITIYDLYLMNQRKENPRFIYKNRNRIIFINKLRSTLSLYRNFKRLFATKQLWINYRQISNRNNKPINEKKKDQADGDCKDEQIAQLVKTDDLLFVNFFRIISMPMIILGHVSLFVQLSTKTPLDQSSNKSGYHLHASTLFFIDWHLTISGFTTIYSIFARKTSEKLSLPVIVCKVIKRYWRLLPVYLFVFWSTKSLMIHTNSGGNWDYGTSNVTMRGVCSQESWFWPLTFTANLHPINQECLMPAWYLASEMQFHIIALILAFVLFRSAILGWLLAIVLLLASHIMKFIDYLLHEKHLDIHRAIKLESIVKHDYIRHSNYLNPQYRLPAYLIGLLAGHYAYMILSGKWTSIMYNRRDNSNQRLKKSSNKTIVRAAIWILGITLFYTMTLWSIMIHIASFRFYADSLIAANTSIASNTLVGIALVCILVTTMFGQFPKLRKLMSYPYWTVISKFNLCTLLIQAEVINWYLRSFEQMPLFLNMDLSRVWHISILTSYCLAASLVLWIELPMENIRRELSNVLESKKNVNSLRGQRAMVSPSSYTELSCQN